MTKREAAEKEKAEAAAQLREILPPGSTVYCILRSRSRSGMSRVISFLGPNHEWLDPLIAKLGDYKRKGDGLRVDGCGMDMGFAVVYNTSATIYPNGFGCIGNESNGALGRYCPSNDHSNGDRDYTPHGPRDENGDPEDREPATGEAADGLRRHWHRSGGYALRHSWL